MYIVCANPSVVPLSDGGYSYVTRPEHLNKCIKDLAKKYPDIEIHCYRLTRKSVPKVTVQLTEYVIHENGEIIPA